MSKEFKGIWIPKEILELKDIGTTEKMILSVILALDNDKGCTANNRYFAELFGLTRTRVSMIIQKLYNKSYIGGVNKVIGGVQQKLHRVLKFTYKGDVTKVITYNILDNSINRSIDIKYPFESLEFIDQWDRWLRYKKDEHRFTFKTTDSHQTALNTLFKDSGGREEVAREMINNSIGNGYKGLFKLKQNGQQSTDSHQNVFDELERIKLQQSGNQ